MLNFGTRGRPELVAAADAADVVDAHVRDLYMLLHRSASVLSEVEYEELVREFETVVGPVRTTRERFDALLDGGGDDRAAFAEVAEKLTGHVDALVTAAQALREYADAQALCARTSGELLNELGRIESAYAGQDEWAELAAWGRDQVNAAAAQAEVRNWLAAHRILVAAKRTVAEAGRQVESVREEQGSKRTRISALAADAATLGARGTEAVASFARLEAESPADAAVYRPALVEAGVVYQQVTAAVAAWNVNLDDPDYDLGALEERAVAARADLDKFLAYAAEVLP